MVASTRKISLLALLCGVSTNALAYFTDEINFDLPEVSQPGQVIDDEYVGFDTGFDILFRGTKYVSGSYTNNDVQTVDNPLTVYNSNPPIGNDPDLEALFTDIPSFTGDVLDGDSTPGNVLILQELGTGQNCSATVCENPDDIGNRPAGTMWFSFSEPVELDSIDFFDIELAEDGATEFNEINLYSDLAATDLVYTSYTPHTGGDNHWDRVFFDQGNIQLVEVRLGGSGAIDNIRFSRSITITSVPEPVSIGLFAAGLGLIGWHRRQRSA